MALTRDQLVRTLISGGLSRRAALVLADELSSNAASTSSGFASINTQSGTTYTFALADAGTGGNSVLNEFTAASAVTATIPPNSSVAFPVGSVLCVSQAGAGQITLTAGAGVTLRVPNGAKTAQQWSQTVATQRATNDWIVSGDTTT